MASGIVLSPKSSLKHLSILIARLRCQ
jgi:hypothetical protein